jgi:hypothetical protein
MTVSRARSKVLRAVMILAAAVALPPFFALAIAPMLLVSFPIAFVVIPFMIPAFFGGAHSSHVESVRIRSLRPAPNARLAMAGH